MHSRAINTKKYSIGDTSPAWVLCTAIKAGLQKNRREARLGGQMGGGGHGGPATCIYKAAMLANGSTSPISFNLTADSFDRLPVLIFPPGSTGD